jgi:hypothetical protein
MQPAAPLHVRVERFSRWHALLIGFDLAVALAGAWNAWRWWDAGDALDFPVMAGLSLGVFLMVLTAQVPYWKIRSFTLSHGAQGWELQQERRQRRLAQVRALSLPGLLLVLGLSDRGREVLPVPSDIAPAVWRELRTRLAL